jgi:hypothetical protein
VKDASGVLVTTRQVAHAARLDDVMRGVEQEPIAPVIGDSTGISLPVGGGAMTPPKAQSTEPTARRPGKG